MTIRDDDTLVKMPTQIDPSAGTQVSKVWWDGEKLMAQPIPLEQLYREPEQPAQQEPLTDEYIERIYHRYGGDMINCARAIERAAQRTWVGLVWGELPEDGQNHDFLRGAVWAETKLKEKNA